MTLEFQLRGLIVGVRIKTILYCHSVVYVDLTVGTLKITDRQETETQLLAQGAGQSDGPFAL